MSNINELLISKDNGKLQISYADYTKLMEKVEQGRELRKTRDRVVSLLSGFLGGEASIKEVAAKIETARMDNEPKPAPEKVEIEFASEKPKVEAAEPQENAAVKAKSRKQTESIDIPPIKADIADHFNKLDESGRLFSVFKQYYTFLNESCGGTVRVTMKDGFCSLWNYDEWEEFAFVDIFEGQLRIAVDPRYTDALHSLRICEVPRLLSSRRNLVCVQVDDLNNTMLDTLAQAFEEVGLTAG